MDEKENIKVEINTNDKKDSSEKPEPTEKEAEQEDSKSAEIEKLKAEIEMLKKANLSNSTDFMSETDKKSFDALDIAVEDKAKMIEFLKNYGKQVQAYGLCTVCNIKNGIEFILLKRVEYYYHCSYRGIIV